MNLLHIEGLTKRFGAFKAVNDVNLEIGDGELISLVGSNGAGKTTLVNLVSAMLLPDEGRILFRGQDVTETSINERVRIGIARSFQLVNLFDRMTAQDNVAMSIFSRDGKSRRLATLAHSDRPVIDEAVEVLAAFGLEDVRNEKASNLAHGERKLLDVAVAFALRPSLLFLDEPTSGVSTRDKTKIMDTISSVVREEKITAVIVEHDMDVVFKYSDRIIAMHQGAIFADGTPEEIRNSEAVATTVLGNPLKH